MKKDIRRKTGLSINNGLEGETLENKVRRIILNNEPIKDGAPLIYTERDEGIKAGYDIRTDRWDVAYEAMNAVNRVNIAKAKGSVKLDGQTESTTAKPE